MIRISKQPVNRRHFIAGGAAAISMSGPVFSQQQPEFLSPPPVPVERNVSTYQSLNWRDYFDELTNGAIVSDTEARILHFWSEDGGTYNVYPTSVPMTDELTKRGRTEITRKRVGPDWRPTENMLKRDPTLPKYVGPGPDNPLGTHALYLSWQYYRIHGTNDTRKIGRRSSNGCIGLFNDQIAELFELTKVGTQVILI